MLKIAVFVSGGGTNLQSLIDAVQSGSINGEIVLVVSNRQNAYGLKRAKNAGIDARCIKDDETLIACLQEKQVDLIVLAGYLAIVSQRLIDLYPHRIMNIHPSLIPSFCGPGFYGIHVHEHAFQRGVKVAGATVHFVSPVVDGGPIILQKAIDVSSATSPQQMQDMVLNQVEHIILPQAVRLYCEGRIKVENERVEII